MRAHTFVLLPNLLNLKRLMQTLHARGVAGDVVECGVYKGGSAAVLASELHPNQSIFLYDSFEGMPPTSDKDPNSAEVMVGEGAVDLNAVIALIEKNKAPGGVVVTHKGWFDQTFSQSPRPERVMLLHVDCDWYESAMACLREFYDKIPVGGCVVLDDYGYWEGARKAFYDFCKERDIYPLLKRVPNGHAYWFKGEERE